MYSPCGFALVPDECPSDNAADDAPTANAVDAATTDATALLFFEYI